MFHDIPEKILQRMATLEAIDARDRQDGTPHVQRLRQVVPDTARLLALMAASAPAGQVLEVGASAGYSALWISLACRLRGDRLVTFEIMEEKARLARQTIAEAGVQDLVELVQGDARQFLRADKRAYEQVAFCFIDAEKSVYQDVFDLVVPKLAPGGLILADNVTSHPVELGPFVEYAQADRRVDSLVLPVGKGVLVCRKI